MITNSNYITIIDNLIDNYMSYDNIKSWAENYLTNEYKGLVSEFEKAYSTNKHQLSSDIPLSKIINNILKRAYLFDRYCELQGYLKQIENNKICIYNDEPYNIEDIKKSNITSGLGDESIKKLLCHNSEYLIKKPTNKSGRKFRFIISVVIPTYLKTTNTRNKTLLVNLYREKNKIMLDDDMSYLYKMLDECQAVVDRKNEIGFHRTLHQYINTNKTLENIKFFVDKLTIDHIDINQLVSKAISKTYIMRIAYINTYQKDLSDNDLSQILLFVIMSDVQVLELSKRLFGKGV